LLTKTFSETARRRFYGVATRPYHFHLCSDQARRYPQKNA
jgi:hypothetical protein